MRRLKGCSSVKCIANKNKHTFKEANNYCSKCGNTLYYVCKKCHTQLPGDSDKYCVRCSAQKQDKKESTLKIAGGITMTVVVAAASTGKKVIKVMSKLKG
ncbi:MAG TPA: hypothetical protein GX707_13100 [Epulopiscium sp.]|nr:hypothetical protein [Candidatus Epulonipiscium sp.]